MTDVGRPRTRRLVSIVAMLVPVVVLVGAAAWFVRSYVLPATMTVAEPPAIATRQMTAKSADILPARGPATAPGPASETTGSAVQTTTSNWTPALPVQPARPAVSSIWDSVPLPGPPRQTQRLATEPAASSSEPISGPVPLPRQPPRPRLSADAGDRVPLPKPRPAIAN